MSASFKAVVEQALDLSEDERGQLLALLLRSLDPEDADKVDAPEWEAAWSSELDRRIRDIREGSVDLIDGDEARARVRAAVDARRK